MVEVLFLYFFFKMDDIIVYRTLMEKSSVCANNDGTGDRKVDV